MSDRHSHFNLSFLLLTRTYIIAKHNKIYFYRNNQSYSIVFQKLILQKKPQKTAKNKFI